MGESDGQRQELAEQSVCAKCGEARPSWWQFGVGCPTRKVYCLDHIPLRYRLKVLVAGAHTFMRRSYCPAAR